jgi:hypothetical protein
MNFWHKKKDEEELNKYNVSVVFMFVLFGNLSLSEDLPRFHYMGLKELRCNIKTENGNEWNVK